MATKRESQHGGAVLLGAMFVVTTFGTQLAPAQTYTVLHRFTNRTV